jgi:hypothetical protein
MSTNACSRISHHTGLNYRFDLNESQIIDAMHAGNEMRYLNHTGPTTAEGFATATINKNSVEPSANCHGQGKGFMVSKSLLVNKNL